MLTRLAVYRPVTTVMSCLIVAILGVMALRNLRVDIMPDTTYPVVTVTTLYAGAGPEEIETLLTRPIEQIIGSVQGVERMSSQSLEGSSSVRVQFAWGTPIDPAIADIRARLERLRQVLPPGSETPYIRRYDSADMPIIYLGLSTSLPLIEATLLAENTIAPQLEQVPGIARVRVRGGSRREIQVDLDRQKLESLNLSVSEVIDALQRDNISQPAGDLEQGQLRMLVRSRAEFTRLEEIEDTVVRQREGAAVRIRELGQVIDGEERRTEEMRVDGQSGMLIYVYKQTGANTVEVSDGIRRAIDTINRTLTVGQLSVRVDKADYIRTSMRNVRDAVLVGTGLTVLVLLIFLRSLQSTLVVAVTMPLALLATLVLIYFNGLTLNMISFGGLALGIGMLVDNSIVVLEAIYLKRDQGADPVTAAVDGTREVASAVIASTLTTCVVFLPLLFLTGQTSLIVRDLALVVFYSQICSLVVSLTLIPMLTARLRFADVSGRRGPVALRLLIQPVLAFHALNRWLYERTESATLSVTGGLLRFPLMTGAGLLLALAVAGGLIPRIGTEFFPKTDEGRIWITAQMAPGIQLPYLRDAVVKLESRLMPLVPEQLSVASQIGNDIDSADEWNEAWISINLVPRDQRSRTAEEVRKALADAAGEIPGVKLRINVRNDLVQSQSFGLQNSAGVVVQIRGHDQKTASVLAERVAEVMRSVPGLINVDPHTADRLPELAVRIDRTRASLLGIPVRSITQTLESAVRGTRTTVFREGGNEFNVLVRLRESDRKGIADVEQVGVATPAGKIVPLKGVVSFESGYAASMIDRLDRQRVVYVSASVEGRDLGHAVRDLETALRTLPPVDGFTVSISGDWENQQKSFRSLTIGFILAVVMMYMVMASQFESIFDPLLILISLPLGGIGVVAMLLSTGTTLNVQSFIGCVLLAGIVVNNAIVLIDCMNSIHHSHPELSPTDIVLQACRRRLRPILMTTLTTVLGMIPVATGTGDGGELQAPLARVVVGGLLSGTLITLVAIPLAWRATHSLLRRSRSGQP